LVATDLWRLTATAGRLAACDASSAWTASMSEATTIAVVLAGQRQGVINPLAARAGVSHKCLVPLAGKPLIAHVLETLTTVPDLTEIRISVEPSAEPDLRPILAEFAANGVPIRLVPSEARLADSL